MQTMQTIHDQLVIVMLEITSWSGRTKLRPEDLKGDLQGIPPSELASLGTLKFLDPQRLQALTTLRAAAYRKCLEVGSRFLGGYALPLDKADDCLAKLDQLKVQYDQVAADIIQEKDRLVAEWAAQHPEWEGAIQAAAARAAAHQHHPKFQVVPFSIGTAACAPQALQEALQELPKTLKDEISQEAMAAYRGSFKGRTECTIKTLNVFTRLREKLWGLRFVSPDALAVIADMDEVLARLPANGPYRGSDYQELVALILRLGQGDIRDMAGTPLFGPLLTQPPAVVPTVAPPAPAPSLPPQAPEAPPPSPATFVLVPPVVARPRERRAIW